MGQNSAAKGGVWFMAITENQIDRDLIAAVEDLEYTYCPDIHDRAVLEANFREKFEALNRARLIDSKFQHLLDNVITPDVYNTTQTLRDINSFERDDNTPLNYALVNIRDWCKNHFEMVRQLRISTDSDRFKAEKQTHELAGIGARHGLGASAPQTFVDEVLRRRIFDSEALSDPMAPLAPLGLGWKARIEKELAPVENLTPLPHKPAQGHEIAGLSAYEEGR